jgi:transposase
MHYDLSDEEWMLLEPILPRRRKKARIDDRKIVSAIFYVLRTGTPWRELPQHYGPYTTAYNRFNRWCRRGIWTKFLNELAARPQADFVPPGQSPLENALPRCIVGRARKIRPSMPVVLAAAQLQTSTARPRDLLALGA